MDSEHRLITLYALTSREDGFQHARPTESQSSPQEAFGSTHRGERNLSDLAAWKPTVSGIKHWDGSEYLVDGHSPPYVVHKVTSYIVTVPYAGEVLAIDVSFSGDHEQTILALRHAFDPLVGKTLGNRGILTASWPDAMPSGRTLGQDKQQILLMDENAEVFGDRNSSNLMINELAANDKLRQLMFKDTEVAYRPDQTPIQFPVDLNGPTGMVVAVWATNTVATGFQQYGELGRRRLEEMVQVAAQVVAATTRARQVRAETVAMLRELDEIVTYPSGEHGEGDADTKRNTLIKSSSRLARIELALSFGADVMRGPGLVWGGRPMERYQEALRVESNFDATVDTTGQLVRRVANIIDSLRAIADAQLAHENSKRQSALLEATNGLLAKTSAAQTAAVVASVVLAVVAVTTLFAAFAAIPKSSPNIWITPVPRNASIAALIVASAAIIGYLFRVVGRVAPPKRIKPALKWVALLLVLVSISSLAVAALPTTLDRTGFLVGGLASAALAMFAIAWHGKFETSLPEP